MPDIFFGMFFLFSTIILLSVRFKPSAGTQDTGSPGKRGRRSLPPPASRIPGRRLMGGGEIVYGFMRDGLVDQYYIYAMPVLLGDGIPLFPAGFPKAELTLESCKNFGEIVELVYRRR